MAPHKKRYKVYSAGLYCPWELLYFFLGALWYISFWIASGGIKALDSSWKNSYLYNLNIANHSLFYLPVIVGIIKGSQTWTFGL